jgi:hypothetical protein
VVVTRIRGPLDRESSGVDYAELADGRVVPTTYLFPAGSFLKPKYLAIKDAYGVVHNWVGLRRGYKPKPIPTDDVRYSYDRRTAYQRHTAPTPQEVQALGMAHSAAKGVLDDAERAAEMVAKARHLIKANSRPLAYVAKALHDIDDTQVKKYLWESYTDLKPEDPDIGAFTERLQLFVRQLADNKAAAENMVAEQAMWEEHRRR